MEFSIIVPAYREGNINKILGLLLKQNLSPDMKLNKIFLVATGYGKFSFLKNKKVVVIKEKIRGGKAAAIGNALKRVDSDIVILQSGDVIPSKNTVKELLTPFRNSSIGMATGRPIPLNDKKKFTGFLIHFVWLLHHLISLKNPKAGEILAFRRLTKKIPKKLVADESYLEFIVSKMGYKIVYAPKAIVFNRGPESILYFLKQRIRVYIGHLHIKKQFNYSVSTMSSLKIFKAVIEYFEIKSIRDLKEIYWVFLAIILETSARLIAYVQFYFLNKLPYKWEKIKT